MVISLNDDIQLKVRNYFAFGHLEGCSLLFVMVMLQRYSFYQYVSSAVEVLSAPALETTFSSSSDYLKKNISIFKKFIFIPKKLIWYKFIHFHENTNTKHMIKHFIFDYEIYCKPAHLKIFRIWIQILNIYEFYLHCA